MITSKSLDSLCQCVFNVTPKSKFTEKELDLHESKMFAKKLIARKQLNSYLKDFILDEKECSFTEGIRFLSETILKNKTIAYLKLLCKLIDDPDFENKDFDGTQMRVLKANHIPVKSIVVYSRILKAMESKHHGNHLFPKHFDSFIRIIQVIHFCSTSYSYYEESKNLPF